MACFKKQRDGEFCEFRKSHKTKKIVDQNKIKKNIWKVIHLHIRRRLILVLFIRVVVVIRRSFIVKFKSIFIFI